MIGIQPPNGLEKVGMILSGVRSELRMATFRRRVAVFSFCVFASLFLGLVVGETLFATLMFALINVEVLGSTISGAAFALLVPTVIGAAHVKLHHEGDHFTRWWLHKLSSIGILIFALGISLMVGFSAWQASRDAVAAITTGPTGTLGNVQVDAAPQDSSGIVSWLGVIPNGLLFLGLSFGMIITIYMASFCLGRALQAFNLLTQTPPVSPKVKSVAEALTDDTERAVDLIDDDRIARQYLPFDIKHKFAREAAHACWKVSQAKLIAARRKFDPAHANDPLAAQFHDPDIASISNQFEDEESFCRHMADQIDQLRLHNLIRVLTGLPEHGDEQ